MPIYDYKCSDCEHQIEVIQKINDEPMIVCPKCSKRSLKKLVSAPSFRLKGGGWYETDFKTGNKKNLVQSDVKSKKTPKEQKKTKNSKPAKKD